MTEYEIARFLDKIDQRPDGCWIWTAGITPNGYGKFKLNGRTSGAHRVSYEYFVGLVPTGLEIDHLCRHRACVNPTHLEAVVHPINVQRGLLPILLPILKLGNTNMLGYKHTDAAKAKISAVHRGKIVSAETRARMSAARKGKPGHPCSAEARAKISAANTGRKFGPEWHEKVSAAVRVAMQRPEVKARMALSPRNRGQHHSTEAKAKMAEARRLFWQRKNLTACAAGHEYTEENTHWVTRSDGRRERKCRECVRRRSKLRQSARKVM